VRLSLNQELDTSAQLKRKAAVMEDNYRKIEKENERLQKLTDNQERAANQLQDDLKNERAASSHLKSQLSTVQKKLSLALAIHPPPPIPNHPLPRVSVKITANMPGLQKCNGGR
jgi:hypothetical protein